MKQGQRYKIHFKKEYVEPDIEQLWLILNINEIKLGLGVVYKAPKVSVNSLLKISEMLEDLSSKVDYIIMTGDFNINLMNKNSQDAIYFQNLLYDFGLKQYVINPTRITSSSDSIIDVMCASEELSVNDCDTIDLCNITDHQLVYADFKLECVKNNIVTFQCRDFSSFNINDFAYDASRIDWKLISTEDNVNNKLDLLNTYILSLFDLHAPIINIKPKRYRPPYITYNIRKMIQLKNKAHKKYIKTKTPEHKAYYIDLRNYVNLAIKRERKAYFEYSLNHKNKGSNIWTQLRKLGINNKQNKELPPNLHDVQSLNHYYVNVAGETSVNENLIEYYEENRFSENIVFNFQEIDNNCIYKIVNTIKSEAYGTDNINLKMLMLVLPYCVDAIKDIINFCLRHGVFPDNWKTALVLPIPKITTPSEFKDLRPINILPCLSKLLEKIVNFQLKEYLETNSIIPSVQSGFRKQHGTGTALLKVMGDIANNIDKGNLSILILLDQSKAFDVVNHKLIIAKLKYIGLSDVSLNWFSSYLSNRQQKVKINYIESDELTLRSGVPQGSILGPILFSIFTLDVPKCFSKCKLHLYADDVQIYISANITEVERATSDINVELNNFCTWCYDNGLKLNPSKSKAIMLGNERVRKNISLNHLNIRINDTIISWVDSTKNLGLVIDNNVNFSEQVNNVRKGSFAVLKSLYKFKYDMKQETKLLLVKALIYPKIEYCSSVYYYHLTGYNRQRLQRIQNACVRFVCCVPFGEHISPYLERLGEINVFQRVTYLYSLFLYKMIKSERPGYLYNMLTLRSTVHNVNIRNDNYTIPQHNTTKFQGSFLYTAPKLLNYLLDIINHHLGTFKSECRLKLQTDPISL